MTSLPFLNAASVRVAAVLLLLGAVSQNVSAQALTRDLAASVIRSALGLVSAPVVVAGVSQATPQTTEAVVLATLGGRELRLNFRRYDTGWRWETTETDNGTRVAASVTVAAFATKARQERVAAWVNQNRAKYADTAETFWWVSTAAPNLVTDELTDSLAQKRYADWIKAVSVSNRTDAEKARLLKKLDPVPLDGWGRRILTKADPIKRTLLVASTGPDGKYDTSDDLICLFVGYEHADSEYGGLRWDYRPVCRVPEGLTDVVSKVGEGQLSTTTTQVVK
jgi:hypothetical protein